MKIIANLEYTEFVNRVKQGRQIICYGAGLVGLSIEDIFIESGIDRKVVCFIDGNSQKAGTTFGLFGREMAIRDIDGLRAMDLSDKVLLLTLDAFDTVIETLNRYAELDNLDCFIFPALNRSYIRQTVSAPDFLCENRFIASNKNIPRTIHYCWFGGKVMSPFMLECIASWSKHNPGYDIVQWNEDNYDVYQNEYMKQAYQSKKYAFVSDFARLDVLHKFGGVYLDTDVAVLKSFDDMLCNEAFIAYNEWAVPNSAISGSVAGNPLIKEMCDNPRSRMNFIYPDGSFNLTNNSIYEAKILAKTGFKKNFTYQTLNNITVYPPCVFPQIGRLGSNAKISDRTIAVHYAVGTWTDKQGYCYETD